MQELYRLLVERLKENDFQELCERAVHDQEGETVIMPWIAVLPGGRVLTIDVSSTSPPGDRLKVRIGKLDASVRAGGAACDDPIDQAIHSPVDVESIMEVIRTVTR